MRKTIKMIVMLVIGHAYTLLAQNIGVGLLNPQARFHIRVPNNWSSDIFRIDAAGAQQPFLIVTKEGRVGIGITAPNNSSIVDISTKAAGILIPRLTSSQRDSISGPAHSLLIFNVDNFCIETYDTLTKQWLKVSCPRACPPCDTCSVPRIDSVKLLRGYCVGDTVVIAVYYVIGGIPVWAFPSQWRIINVGDTAIIESGSSYGGLVKVGVCNECGCSYDSILVTLLQGNLTPSVNIIGDTAACEGDTLVFKAPHISASSWTWSFPNTWQTIYQNGDSLVVAIDTVDGYVSVEVCNDSCLCAKDSIYVHAYSCMTFCTAVGGGGDEWGWRVIGKGNKFYVVGTTTSFGQGGVDIYLVGYDMRGNIIDTIVIGGVAEDWASGIIATTDGFLIAGHTHSFGAASRDVYVVNLNNSFGIRWDKLIGGAHYDRMRDVDLLGTSSYVLAGATATFTAGLDDFYVIRIDSIGNLIWSLSIGGAAHDRGRALAVDKHGNIYVVGVTHSFGQGNGDVYIVKIDSAGNLLWTRSIGGTNFDQAWDVMYLGNGKLVVVGETQSFGAGLTDVYVIMMDSTGNVLWDVAIGGPGEELARAVDTLGNDIVIAGYTTSFGAGNRDMYLAVLDTNGNLKWTRTIGGLNDEEAYGLYVWDYGIFITGYATSFGQGGRDVYLVGLNRSGNFEMCVSGCEVSNGGSAQFVGGVVGSGGNTRGGGTVASGNGIVTTGGIVTRICP